MKIKKYYTVRKVPKTNYKIIEAEEKLIPIIQIYMTRAFNISQLYQYFIIKISMYILCNTLSIQEVPNII
jgi:cell fate (sporulation/competence/biofilm development) regulator YmcA (YheA/YmcA/DUF963 family)